MLKNIEILIFISLFFISTSNCQPQTNRPLPPIRHAPNREFHMINLALNLHFNIQKKEVIGVATEKIVPFRVKYNAVHLNAVDMKIGKVTLGNKDLKYDYDGKILTIKLDKDYGLNDTLTYSINYTTIPKKGIFFILPDKGYPDRIPEIWSQSESEDARYWYPCHDYPDDFSTSSLTATVPEDWVVVSNGLLKKTNVNKSDHTKTFYWVESKPHVVYLNSIVAGKYKILKSKWDDVPIYYYVEPKYVNDAKSNFSHTPDILKYFSDVTGYHYAWQKLSLSSVTDFTAGGMENVSAITLTDNTFHDKNAEPEESTTDLVSHETAHQWFGDLLTCRSWSHAWLNEGFATYFEALYGRHAFGNDHFAYEMLKDQKQVIAADNRNRQSTIYRRYNSPEDVFSVYIYPRGADILNMLRGVLGEQLFFKTIRHYVHEFQFKSVTTHDLADAVRQATGENLDWFFKEWLHKAGHPKFDVKYSYNNFSHKLLMTVNQTQKVDSLTPVYKMPVEVYIVTPSEKLTKTIWVDSLHNSYTFNVPGKPLMVNFDEDNFLLKELNFKKSVNELVYQLQNDPNLTGRIWAVDQLKNDNGEKVVNAIIKALKNDSFWGVRAECATALSKFNDDTTSESALIYALNDKDPRVQVNAINSLAKFKDVKLANTIRDKFKNANNYFVRAATITTYASVDSANALPLVKEAFKLDSYRQVIRSAALNALAKLDSVKAYDKAVAFSAYGQPQSIRLRSISFLISHNVNKEKTIKLLSEYTKDPYWIAQLIAIYGLGRVGDKSVIPLLKQIVKEDTNSRVVESAQRSIKMIEKKESKGKKT